MPARITTLENGFRIVTDPVPAAHAVAISLRVPSGSRHEQPHEHGLSHLLEHMAFRGTGRRTGREITDAIEGAGGWINAGTGVEDTVYSAVMLPGDLATGCDVLADIVLEPLFDPDLLEREKRVVLQEIGEALDTPESLVSDCLHATAFPDQAVGRPVLGSRDSVTAQDCNSLRRFSGGCLRTREMCLAVAGKVTDARVVALAGRLFGQLPDRPPSRTEPARYRGGHRLCHRDLGQNYISLAFPSVSHADPDFHTASILAGILGGGMSSRLFQEVREKHGLCYSIECVLEPLEDAGLLSVHTSTAADGARSLELLRLVRRVLEDVAAGVPARELARARKQFMAGLLMSLDSPSARCGHIAHALLARGEAFSVRAVRERTGAVTRRGIEQMAAGLLSLVPAIAVVGPGTATPDLGGAGFREPDAQKKSRAIVEDTTARDGPGQAAALVQGARPGKITRP